MLISVFHLPALSQFFASTFFCLSHILTLFSSLQLLPQPFLSVRLVFVDISVYRMGLSKLLTLLYARHRLSRSRSLHLHLSLSVGVLGLLLGLGPCARLWQMETVAAAGSGVTLIMAQKWPNCAAKYKMLTGYHSEQGRGRRRGSRRKGGVSGEKGR